MASEIHIVRDVSRKLDQAGIGYMLTGSMAMNYYAQPRMTRDIDVVIALGPNDVERLASLFEAEYYVSKESIRESVAHESVFNLIHHESVIKIDFIVRKQGEYRQLEFERRQEGLNSRFHYLHREQRRPDHFETLVGQGFPFRGSTGRREEPARDRLRYDISGTLDTRAGTE